MSTDKYLSFNIFFFVLIFLTRNSSGLKCHSFLWNHPVKASFNYISDVIDDNKYCANSVVSFGYGYYVLGGVVSSCNRPRRSCSFLNPIPGTNCCCQSNLCNEFTRISKDATNLSIGPSNVNIPRPPSANIPRPPSANIPGPSGVYIPGPSGANIPGPSGVYIPGPSGVNIPGPSGVNIPGPSGVNIPGPSGVRISRPLGVRAPRPLGVRAPRPSGVRAPRPSGVRAPKPSLVGISRPSSVNIPQISGANIPQPHSLQCHDFNFKLVEGQGHNYRRTKYGDHYFCQIVSNINFRNNNTFYVSGGHSIICNDPKPSCEVKDLSNLKEYCCCKSHFCNKFGLIFNNSTDASWKP